MHKKFLVLITIFSQILLPGVVFAATSTPRVVKPKIITLPQVPLLSAKVSGTKVSLRWGVASKKTKFTSYSVFRSEKLYKLGNFIGSATTSERGFFDIATMPGHTYYYSVRYELKGARLTNGRQVKAPIKKSAVIGATPQMTGNQISPSSTLPNVFASTTTRTQITPEQPTNPLITNPTAPSTPNIFTDINPTAPPITDTRASTNDAARLTTLYQLQTALQGFYNDQGFYPAGSSLVLGQSQTMCLNSVGWNAADCAYPYFGSIPADPGSSAYVYSSSGAAYTVTVTLDGTINGLSGTIQASPSGISKI